MIEWPWHDDSGQLPEGVPAARAQTLRDHRHYVERGALDRLRGQAPADGNVSSIVRLGRPWIETLAVAEAVGADLIVLGVQGRGPVDLEFFGSRPTHVVRAAKCPVLTVRS